MTPLDSAERLINLIIALQHAPVRMTRHQIRTTVAGYEQASDSQDPADVRKRDAAFERMFERDKDTLRAMGIPLETVTDATHGDDIGYRIRMDAVELPAVHLTATEAALVRVAVHLWDEARTSTVAQQALTKVAAAADQGTALSLNVGGTMTHVTDAWLALVDALEARQSVTFEYSSSRSGVATRRVQPYRLSLRGSAAYVTGWDLDADSVRTFRLNRIQGTVTAVGQPGQYQIPDHIDDDHAGSLTEQHRVVLEIRPEAAHDVRREGTVREHRDGWDVVDVTVPDLSWVRDRVLMAGGAVRVVEPHELAQAVVDAARGIVAVCDG